MDTIGHTIKKLRVKKGLTQKELAKALNLSLSSIISYENGLRTPNAKAMMALENYFNMSIAELSGKESSSVVESSYPKELIPLDNLGVKNIPLIGNIPCGTPVLAVENTESYINIVGDVPADFALRCNGDSMINARIFDNDIVLIRKQPIVENGEIAAVMIEDEVTLKRFYKLDDYIELRAENPRYAPIVITKKMADNLHILGKAVAFISTI